MRSLKKWGLIFILSLNKLTQNSQDVDTTKNEQPQKVRHRNSVKDYIKNYRTFAPTS